MKPSEEEEEEEDVVNNKYDEDHYIFLKFESPLHL
jgi:hypothetical protein